MVVPQSGTSGRFLVSRDRATSTRSNAAGFDGPRARAAPRRRRNRATRRASAGGLAARSHAQVVGPCPSVVTHQDTHQTVEVTHQDTHQCAHRSWSEDRRRRNLERLLSRTVRAATFPWRHACFADSGSDRGCSLAHRGTQPVRKRVAQSMRPDRVGVVVFRFPDQGVNDE